MGVAADRIPGYAESLLGEPTSRVCAQYVTDVMFRTRIIEWSKLRAGSPTWYYDFTWRSEVSGLAEHCVDVPFYFDVLEADGVTRVLGENPPAALAEKVHGAWVRMIATGDPGWERDEVTVLDTHVVAGVDTYASARALA
jgi:para-nitrobenzyl esterase